MIKVLIILMTFVFATQAHAISPKGTFGKGSKGRSTKKPCESVLTHGEGNIHSAYKGREFNEVRKFAKEYVVENSPLGVTINPVDSEVTSAMEGIVLFYHRAFGPAMRGGGQRLYIVNVSFRVGTAKAQQVKNITIIRGWDGQLRGFESVDQDAAGPNQLLASDRMALEDTAIKALKAKFARDHRPGIRADGPLPEKVFEIASVEDASGIRTGIVAVNVFQEVRNFYHAHRFIVTIADGQVEGISDRVALPGDGGPSQTQRLNPIQVKRLKASIREFRTNQGFLDDAKAIVIGDDAGENDFTVTVTRSTEIGDRSEYYNVHIRRNRPVEIVPAGAQG